MLKIVVTGAAALAIGATCISANAEAWTGSTLLRLYRASEGGQRMVGSFAYGAVGTEEVLRALNDASPGVLPMKMVACIPSGVSPEQLGELVIKYVRENPQIQHQSAFVLTRGAFIQAWPCE